MVKYFNVIALFKFFSLIHAPWKEFMTPFLILVGFVENNTAFIGGGIYVSLFYTIERVSLQNNSIQGGCVKFAVKWFDIL